MPVHGTILCNVHTRSVDAQYVRLDDIPREIIEQRLAKCHVAEMIVRHDIEWNVWVTLQTPSDPFN